MPERSLVRESGRCAPENRSLASGVQRISSAQQPGLSHPGGVRATVVPFILNHRRRADRGACQGFPDGASVLDRLPGPLPSTDMRMKGSSEGVMIDRETLVPIGG